MPAISLVNSAAAPPFVSPHETSRLATPPVDEGGPCPSDMARIYGYCIDRYEAPNVRALNFVMHGALGGGGPASLRADALGKTLGGALVRMEIDVPEELATRRRPL